MHEDITEQEFNEFCKDYRIMNEVSYIREYCGNKYFNFGDTIRGFKRYCEFLPFYDALYYIDEARKIIIECLTSIGD